MSVCEAAVYKDKAPKEDGNRAFTIHLEASKGFLPPYFKHVGVFLRGRGSNTGRPDFLMLLLYTHSCQETFVRNGAG